MSGKSNEPRCDMDGGFFYQVFDENISWHFSLSSPRSSQKLRAVFKPHSYLIDILLFNEAKQMS